MKYLDLFAGYGGFSLGIQQAYEKKNSRLVNKKRSVDTLSRGQKTQHCSRKCDTSSKQSSNGSHKPKATCVGFSEINKYAIQVYNKQFNHKNYGDITQINPTTLPDFDLLTGGFPC